MLNLRNTKDESDESEQENKWLILLKNAIFR